MYMHRFPLFSPSARQKVLLTAARNASASRIIIISNIKGHAAIV